MLFAFARWKQEEDVGEQGRKHFIHLPGDETFDEMVNAEQARVGQ